MAEFINKWLLDPTVGKIVTALFAIIILIAIVRFIQRLLSKKIKDTDTRYRIRKSVSFFGYLAAVFVLTIVFSDRLGGLTVAFGVAGAGIAFALQEVIVSFAGWFAISFAKFYKPGDRVQLGGIKGDVIDIGILRTTLMEVGQWVNGDLYNGRVVRIANSFVFKDPVFNYSGDFPFLWDEITVPIKYGSDYNLAREIFSKISNELLGEYSQRAKSAWEDLVKKFLIENASVEPMITMIANDNWVEFTIRYVVDYKFRRTIKDKMFMRILEEVDKNKDKIGLASATFHLVETPTINVKLDN
ncbi:MAG: mechanosensitive ion channel family protein [Ignavibacteria bacterium]|nr:mechanosensitive ion channel family protein [Ignavibacteria bacterium]MBT8381815.1 mechanosensitive ion channel family protein [Ignavibacteria bacterium]MBT8392491.1 mechanosensitive ion channel family protein [Ignavibacteria bacterium]NNJ53568.1 mechanosensitive ion channel family protein [Ignavibacteriaceae bacterium]NNL22070.1 mechanosensitive ion channel family protein [Ignavibacteriaceae bacterium]